MADAVAALRKALGDRYDPEGLALNLNLLGLTDDEIVADCEELAASIKRLDEIGRRGGIW